MQSNSICRRALNLGGFVAALLGGLALAVPVKAGQYQLLAEQANTVVVAARVQNAEQVCNLEISIQGQASLEREVRAPHFEARIDITPKDAESVVVTWRGKSKRVNDEVVNACPTLGRTQFQVVNDNVALRAAWLSGLAAMGQAKAECVRTALQLDRVRIEWFDMNSPESSPEDWKIQRAMGQCDAFLAQKKAWGEQNPKSFPCVQSGVKTRCEGFYSVTENGKNRPISAEAAIRRQLDKQPWGTGMRETAGAKVARQKQEQALKDQQLAEEQAKVKAAIEAREREEQMAIEAIAAQARERKAKAEADHARRLQELERREQERLEKRSWMLKQLEKLKSDPKADAKSDAKPVDGKAPEAQAEQVKPKDAATSDVKSEEPKPK
ncbi:hypothetical protein [Limnohabitans sp. Rim47]|uniref:hypothetical protein n=1 Tax=Limnohabitans sp. Rim47 TaxID=1100721 RepID=UPI0012DD6C3D|nr:hypothetical protein [Limnohabitans sp. Rim47]